MLPVLDEFREKLDNIMLQPMHNTILLYGYESYTGRFLKWYAEYYHSIEIDYLVSTDMDRGRSYDKEIFRPSVLEFDYKNVNNAVIWLAEPLTEEIGNILNNAGKVKGKTYFDFYEIIYGSDIYGLKEVNTDIFKKKKEGKRDIQFLEWLEWKYECNFVTRISQEFFEVAKEHGKAYGCTTQKEIFPILDRCHCIPQEEDAIFDYGCGKGGALVSFLDYGFKRVGGIEYEPKIYEVLTDNINKLGLGKYAELLYGDAGELAEELDKYNWFYFFSPFDSFIFKKCIKALCDSYKRRKRKIHIVSIAPFEHECIQKTGIFRLTNQFTIDMRQRVVDVFESYCAIDKKTITAVIPSRYQSTRFPGKPLAILAGKTMIQRVYEQVKQVESVNEVIAATDDERIYDAVLEFNGKAAMTGECSCGTERVYAAIKDHACDIVINVQGDEPLIKPEMINELIAAFEDDSVEMATLCKEITETEDINNPNIVKVVRDKDDNALYFSRYPIPFNRDKRDDVRYFKHIGIYGYKKGFLERYVQTEKTPLELAENLEQLRVLESGHKIRVKETIYDSIGVDMPEDVLKIEKEIGSV